ncbi:CRISPR-associated endoribonuclease Cas6 [Calditerricola satsumensis]|uniref:CRISPR-associated endoribonuclease n=1 Tax=Calditerricola satsumensis TaxID=373054 RepID=A0A8J3BDP4_9BACI|nr:CRISPR-associated endoribonuclease Cas6 [Calditerricola satsumensis]GGK07244.1 CRISPR-associated endoribonuclease Cas6 [Calditerricola satsumensis]
MHLHITLTSPTGALRLPFSYPYWIQSALYRALDARFATKLHDEGFRYGKRAFRLFSFSRLLGAYVLDRDRKEIVFSNPIRLVVASPLEEFLRQLSDLLIKEEGLRLGEQTVFIEEIAYRRVRVDRNPLVVHTLSPITVYSTMTRGDGKRYTYYYAPKEKPFAELIHQNLVKKWTALTGEPYAGPETVVKPVGRTRLHLVTYKGTVVKGWSGRFVLEGDPRLIELGLYAGFGAKNAQGFGLCEPLPDRGESQTC